MALYDESRHLLGSLLLKPSSTGTVMCCPLSPETRSRARFFQPTMVVAGQPRKLTPALIPYTPDTYITVRLQADGNVWTLVYVIMLVI